MKRYVAVVLDDDAVEAPLRELGSLTGSDSLHPAQIDIARRVFSPDPADLAHAMRVLEAMGDGTGAIMLDGKMEDDASVKQCKVVVELARQLAARDPDLAAAYAL